VDDALIKALQSLTTDVQFGTIARSPLQDIQEAAEQRAEALAAATEAKMASGFRQRLMAQIIAFQKQLQANQEVGACVAMFGGAVVIHVTDVGFRNPAIIVLYGVTENDEPVELVQHMSQVSFLLTPVKAKGEARRIGFTSESDREAADGAEE
jgi:hypothetical protein